MKNFVLLNVSFVIYFLVIFTSFYAYPSGFKELSLIIEISNGNDNKLNSFLFYLNVNSGLLNYSSCLDKKQLPNKESEFLAKNTVFSKRESLAPYEKKLIKVDICFNYQDRTGTTKESTVHSLAVNKLYSWITSNINNSSYSGKVKNTSWTLKNKKGDCTEQAMLMVAMAREAGMPARVMGGYIMEKSGRVFAKDYHNWAEVYVDDRWIIVDPYYRVFDDGYDKYIAMQIVDYDDPNAENRRFWIEGAEGVTVKML